jgi:hypothetical protein
MLQREPILCELVHLYIVAGRHREALDELELFELQVLHYESLLTCLDISSIPSFPYRDNAVLHIYAGICSVLVSQPGSAGEVVVQSIDSEMLARAQIFFERAKSLDPENIVVDSLLGMVGIFKFETCYRSLSLYGGKTQKLAQSPMTFQQTEASDDEADPGIESVRVKRLRT